MRRSLNYLRAALTAWMWSELRDEITDVMRDIYFERLASPRRHVRVTEQYSSPKITNLVAFPQVFYGLITVAVARPTVVSVSIIVCVCTRV